MEKDKNQINEVGASKVDYQINKAEDDDTWWLSTKQALSTGELVGELGVRPFGISVVPEELRKGNENAYKPKVVSMGPTHKGTRRDLLQMERIKRLCLCSLLNPVPFIVAAVTPEQGSIEKFSKMVWRNDESIRSCYTEEILLGRNKLATTMLYDCWFMLDLLVICSEKEEHRRMCGFGDVFILTPVRIMEEVLTDLVLLENQIPLALVINLSQKLFPKQFGHDISSTTLNTFKDMALSLLHCSPPPPPPDHGHFHYTDDIATSDPPAHFLELVHSSIFLGSDGDDEEVKPEENDKRRLPLPMAHNNTEEEHKVDGGLILNRCATRLHAAGVTIKPPDEQRESTEKPSPTISSFNFDIRFRNGTLEIPQLHITEATETLWRNFIAWEHHKKKWGSNFRNAALEANLEVMEGHNFRCKCTSAALLFNGLICCSSDVQLLKDKRVIVDHLNMSNRELVDFFHSITMGVDRGIVVDYSSHKTMVTALNTYSTSNKAKEIPIIGWHCLSKILEDVFYGLSKFLRRRYNFAVTLGLVIGVVQTLYSILSYHQKK